MTTALDQDNAPYDVLGRRGDEPDERIGQATQRELDFPDNEEEERIDHVAERVRLSYKGLRVAVRGLPNSRSVDDSQRSRAAGLFDATQDSVSMSTRLWNAAEPRVKELRKVISAIHRLFHDRSMTLPTTLPGLRRVRKDQVVEVDRRLRGYALQLREAAESLADELPAIVRREQERRGSLFREEDYQFDPTRLVSVGWCFPNVAEDQELAELSDEVYQREVARVRGELRETVRLAEQQLTDGLVESLAHVSERLASGADGRPLVFRDATANKLFDELAHIEEGLRSTGLGGDAMRSAASQIRQMLVGHDRGSLGPALRQSEDMRQRLRQECQRLASQVGKDVTPELRRRVIRPKPPIGQ